MEGKTLREHIDGAEGRRKDARKQIADIKVRVTWL